jgi:hypothetical protein
MTGFRSTAAIILALALIAAVSAGTGSPQIAGLDFSCAAFPADLRDADLVARYGRENVTDAMIVGSDDAPFPGTVLFADNPDMRVEVAWTDPATKVSPLWVRIKGERSRWRLRNGITLGDDLISVERRNGFPFRLASLSTEGQGSVRSWGKGRIESVDTPTCAVKISFQPRRDGTDDPQSMRQVVQGRELSSGHPAMQKLNPRVRAIWIHNQPK